MLNKKEIFIISLIIVIFAFSINISLSLIENWKTFFWSVIAVAIVVLGNVFAKKIMAYNLDSEIEMQVWETGKNPLFLHKRKTSSFPMGAFLPIISKIILFPFKNFIWMASLVFDVRPRIYRGAKRHGLYTFSEITEYHIGLIAASGIAINLLFSLFGYLLGFSLFSRLSMYYAFFNMIPLSELDGNKIFFGSRILWSFLASLILIGMLFAILAI